MRFGFALPYFDEQRNSMSKLLFPLCQALLSAGHQVVIYSGNAAYHGSLASAHRCVKTFRLRPSFLDHLALALLNTWHSYRDHRREPFALVHNLGCGSTFFQQVITAHACHAAWLQRKAVYGERWLALLNPAHWITRCIESFNYCRPHIAIIAVSKPIYDQLLRFHPQVAQRLYLIENGLYTSLLPTPLCEVPSRSGFRISFASNDHRKKGLGPLLGALRIAQDRGLDWRLVVLGCDPQEALFLALAASRGVSSRVEFRGHVDDVIGEMQTTDVFCLPTRYEPFGMVFLEAAAAGIPIVATAEGVVPDLMEGFSPPMLLPHPVSSKHLFDELLRVATDPEYAHRLARHVQKRASDFTESRMVAKTLDVYEQVLGAQHE